MAAVVNSSIKKIIYNNVWWMCSKKTFLFFAAGNQILKYHGDQSVVAWKMQECGVAIWNPFQDITILL